MTDPAGARGFAPSARTAGGVLTLVEAGITVAAGFLIRSISPDPRIGGGLAFAVWFTGALITITSAAVLVKLDQAVRREKTDLQGALAGGMQQLHRALTVFDAYHAANHDDLKKYRDQVLDVARTKLDALKRGEAEIDGDEYYDWLNGRIGKSTLVSAVSYRPLKVYVEDNREKNWAHANTEAAAAGTRIVRLFISKREDLVDTRLREVLRKAILESKATAYVIWADDVDQDVLRRLGGGGFSIYDDKVAFWDRSYFEADVGGADGGFGSVSKPLRPRAVLYCKPHATFDEFVAIFRGLESKVPFTAKGSPVASYQDLLWQVDGYLGSKYTSLQALEASTDPDARSILENWKQIKLEITANQPPALLT